MSEASLFSEIWQLYLYQPLVNLLVYLYNNVAAANLGWAIVALTVCLRIVLLPLSILSERNKFLMDENDEVAEKHFLDIIDKSVEALFPVISDRIHKWAVYWRK